MSKRPRPTQQHNNSPKPTWAHESLTARTKRYRHRLGKSDDNPNVLDQSNEFWQYISLILGFQQQEEEKNVQGSLLFVSFGEALMSAVTPRLQMMLEENAKSILELPKLLHENSQKVDLLRDVNNDNVSRWVHAMGLRIGSCAAFPSWKGQFKLMIPQKVEERTSLDLVMFDYLMPRLNISVASLESRDPGITVLSILRDEALHLQTSSVFKLSIPCEDIQSLCIAKIQFNLVSFILDLKNPPSFFVRRAQAAESGRNQWRQRNDFTQGSQASCLSRVYITLVEREALMFLNSFSHLQVAAKCETSEWKQFKATAYEEPQQPQVFDSHKWSQELKPMSVDTAAIDRLSEEQNALFAKFERKLTVEETVSFDGHEDESELYDSDSECPAWELPVAQAEEMKKMQIVLAVRDLLDKHGKGGGGGKDDCVIC